MVNTSKQNVHDLRGSIEDSETLCAISSEQTKRAPESPKAIGQGTLVSCFPHSETVVFAGLKPLISIVHKCSLLYQSVHSIGSKDFFKLGYIFWLRFLDGKLFNHQTYEKYTSHC